MHLQMTAVLLVDARSWNTSPNRSSRARVRGGGGQREGTGAATLQVAGKKGLEWINPPTASAWPLEIPGSPLVSKISEMDSSKWNGLGAFHR